MFLPKNAIPLPPPRLPANNPWRPVAIFDVDGTLFDNAERVKFLEQEPKDWKAFFDPANVMKDRPIPQVVGLAGMCAISHEIHIVTARREADRVVTEMQLCVVRVPYHTLHIVRKGGDRRPDDVLKREWLEGFEGAGRIDFVVEDRARVARMWREQGFFCFHVAEGEF